MNRLRRPGTRPMSGRPSRLWGRAQARLPRMGASATPGTKAVARVRIRSTHAAGSGSRARKVEPTVATPGRGTRLKWTRSSSGSSDRGALVPIAVPISASSRTWRGPATGSTSTTTPHRGRIGIHRPVGSMSSGDHGPAATRTASQASRCPSTTTPTTSSPRRSSIAERPSRTRTPRRSASVA